MKVKRHCSLFDGTKWHVLLILPSEELLLDLPEFKRSESKSMITILCCSTAKCSTNVHCQCTERRFAVLIPLFFVPEECIFSHNITYFHIFHGDSVHVVPPKRDQCRLMWLGYEWRWLRDSWRASGGRCGAHSNFLVVAFSMEEMATCWKRSRKNLSLETFRDCTRNIWIWNVLN